MAGRRTLAAFPTSTRSEPMDRRVKPSSQSPSIRGRKTAVARSPPVSIPQTQARYCVSSACTRRQRQAGARASRSTRPGDGRRATTSMRRRSLSVRSSRGAAAFCLRRGVTMRGCSGPPRRRRRTSPRWRPPSVLRLRMAARSGLPILGSMRPCAAINGNFRGSRRRSQGSRPAASSLFNLNLRRRWRLCPRRALRSLAPKRRLALGLPPVGRQRRSRVN